MKHTPLLQWLNLLATLALLAVNGLANALPLNGLSTGEISDRFDVLFVPAGYVFAIWGLIYLALVAFTIYQVLPAQRDNPRLARIGYLYLLSSLANIAWLFLWHYEQFPWTLVAMGTLLLSLIAIYLRLDIGRAAVSRAERWLVHLPFSIYLGWISVATIANVTDVLDYLNWSGWGIAPELWAVVMLVAGAALGLASLLTRRDIAYLLVIVWAFVGIALKQSAVLMVAGAAWGLAAVLALAMLWVLLRPRPQMT